MGLSSKPFYENHGAQKIIDFMVEQLYIVLTKLKLFKIILVAHSFGGYISMNLAVKYP